MLGNASNSPLTASLNPDESSRFHSLASCPHAAKYLTVQKSSTVFNCAKQTTVKSRQTKEVRQVRQVPRVPVLSWELWRCQSPPSSSCLEVCHVDFSHEINCSMWYTQLWGWGHYLVGDYLGWACEGGKIRKNKKKNKTSGPPRIYFILFWLFCFYWLPSQLVPYGALLDSALVLTYGVQWKILTEDWDSFRLDGFGSRTHNQIRLVCERPNRRGL